MTNKIDRTKTKAKSVGARTLAMVLCFVMLLTAIGSGSVLSAIAAGFDKGDAAVLANAVKLGADISAAKAEDKASDEPFVDDIEDGYTLSKKKSDADLADTGREVDIAGTGASHYIDSQKIIYFVNTYGWGGVKMHLWTTGNWDETMTRIGSTGIYKFQPSSKFDVEGFQFQDSSNSSNNTSNFYDTVTNDKVYWPNSATDDTTQMNGTAKVVSMIKDEDTGKYVKASDTRCVATISSINVSGGSASSTSGSTGSSDTASCYPAYGASVSYSYSVSGIYQFDGFSTTSSTSLPDGASKSIADRKSNYYPGNKTNLSTVYAYFSKVQYEESTPATASTVASGTVLIWGHEDKFFTNSRAWVFGTGMSASRNIKMNTLGDIHYINNSMINTGDPIDDDYAPSVYLTNGTGTTEGSYPGGDASWWIFSPNDSNSSSYTLSNSDAVYYNDSSNTQWNNFSHLSATTPTLKYNNAAVTEVDSIDSEITVSTTLSGTLSDSSAAVEFYYTKDGKTKKIKGDVTVSSKTYSIKFYPPEYGSYTIKAVAVDSKKVETVHSSTSSLSVGEGYYVTGDADLIKTTAWTYYPSKGAMTETSSGMWTVVFPSVPAGTHDFRITSLSEADHYVTDKDNVSVSGNAGAEVQTSGSSVNNIQFTLLGKSKVTITFNETQSGEKYPVTVDVAEVVGMSVTIYANTGGTVTATYGTTTYNVDAGKSNTFTVGEGETIDLAATPAEGYEFDHWTKNLSNPYEINSANAGASITNETIDKKMVYVAAFTKTGGGSHPSVSDGATAYSGSLHGLLGPADNLKDSGTNYDNLKLYTLDGKLYAYVHVDDDTEVLNKTQSDDTQIKTGKNYYFGVSSSNAGTDLYYHNSGDSLSVSEDGSSGYVTRAVDKEWSGYHMGQFEIDASAAAGSYVRLELGSLSGTALANTSSGTYKVKYISGSGGSSAADVVFDPIMNFYAKDSVFSGQSTTEISTLGALDTTVENVSGLVEVDSTASSGQNFECGLALKGATITVSTTIPHTGSYTALKADGTTETVCADEKYCVIGFSFNGVTPEILDEVAGGSGGATYTCSYKIPDDLEGGLLEITPIYFIKEKYASNCATFYINGYEDMLKNGGSNWGNTLFIYPFYKYYISGSSGTNTTYGGKAENFGAYPGQPVVNYGGQLYTQIPLTCNGTIDGIDTNGNTIKGVTINNGYFDGCHKNYCSFVSEHQQTYDYDDFQKIVKEKSTINGSKYLHSVYFSFKYHAEDTTHQHRKYSTTSSATTDTRYNDMLASGGPGASTTVSDLKTRAENTNNKFEYLTDALGNPVDLFGNPVTVANKTVDPAGEALWVVSMGYEFNNSGQYATEWAVYHTTDGSTLTLVEDSAHGIDSTNATTAYNSSIVPSALIMNGASSFANYPSLDGDQPIGGYEGLYTELTAYKNKPVMICYEYDAYIDYNSPHAYRSDGRWSYTTVNDYVASDIKIQYTTDGSTWTDDTFTSGTNQGSTTKVRAYFTNSAYYGLTESTSQIISNSASDNYKFTAEPSGSYKFVGWYLMDAHGKISTIATDKLSAETRRSGNFTMIARFQYVDSGNLVISHVLNDASTGRGTAYLGVTLDNGSESITLANAASNTEAVTIDSNYISNVSAFTITIELRTVANGENSFKSYSCNITNASDTVSAVSSNTDYWTSAKSTLSTSTYNDISVKNVIYGGDATQDIKGIEYVSSLDAVHYDYNIKYQFTSRAYGSMQYTSTGSLSPGEIGDDTIVTKSGENRILSKTFLASKAPYESNFMQDINWNFDDSGITQTTSYASVTNTYTINVVVPLAAEEDTPQNPIRNAYVTVPYVLENGKTGVASIVGDTASGYLNTVTTTVEDEVITEPVSLTFTISKPYDSYVKDSDDNTLTAPPTLLETNDSSAEVVKYFKYWEVKDHSSTRSDSETVRVLFRCYFPSFNYRLLGDYDIEAIYGDNPEETYATLYAAETKTASTSIAFIGNSRNQWNGGNNIDGGMNASAPKAEGDIVYNDFILSFNPTGNDLIKDIVGAEYGIVIQKLDPIVIDSKTKKNLHNLLWYEDENKDTETAAKTAAKALVGSGTTSSGMLYKQLNTETNAANDKNRMHYAYSMYNNYSAGEKGYDTMKNCKYLYRAFAYMKINGVVTISEKPAYFYMYDEAIK